MIYFLDIIDDIAVALLGNRARVHFLQLLLQLWIRLNIRSGRNASKGNECDLHITYCLACLHHLPTCCITKHDLTFAFSFMYWYSSSEHKFYCITKAITTQDVFTWASKPKISLVVLTHQIRRGGEWKTLFDKFHVGPTKSHENSLFWCIKDEIYSILEYVLRKFNKERIQFIVVFAGDKWRSY